MSDRTSNHDILTVDFSQRGNSQKIFPRPALLSSHGTPWRDIYLEYHEQPGCDTGELVAPAHYIALNVLETPKPVDRWLDGCFQRENLCFGDFVIVPAGATHHCLWQHEEKFINLSFEPTWLEQVSLELTDCERLQLIPKAPPLRDSLIQGVLFGLKQELENGGLAGNLYVDHLKNALAIHLLRNYATHPPELRNYTGGLSRYQLRQAIDYIDAHLDQPLKIVDIATLLGMSQYYFCRLY